MVGKFLRSVAFLAYAFISADRAGKAILLGVVIVSIALLQMAVGAVARMGGSP